jgi:hypothetical protein
LPELPYVLDFEGIEGTAEEYFSTDGRSYDQTSGWGKPSFVTKDGNTKVKLDRSAAAYGAVLYIEFPDFVYEGNTDGESNVLPESKKLVVSFDVDYINQLTSLGDNAGIGWYHNCFTMLLNFSVNFAILAIRILTIEILR